MPRLPEQEVFEHLTVIRRTVHTTYHHPQIGHVFSAGQKTPVYLGFYLDEPVWKRASGLDDPEYQYCANRTMPIEDDPDYCGAVGQQGQEIRVTCSKKASIP